MRHVLLQLVQVHEGLVEQLDVLVDAALQVLVDSLQDERELLLLFQQCRLFKTEKGPVELVIQIEVFSWHNYLALAGQVDLVRLLHCQPLIHVILELLVFALIQSFLEVFGVSHFGDLQAAMDILFGQHFVSKLLAARPVDVPLALNAILDILAQLLQNGFVLRMVHDGGQTLNGDAVRNLFLFILLSGQGSITGRMHLVIVIERVALAVDVAESAVRIAVAFSGRVEPRVLNNLLKRHAVYYNLKL